MEFIPMKQFVLEYVGEIITSDEVIQGCDVCLSIKSQFQDQLLVLNGQLISTKTLGWI